MGDVGVHLVDLVRWLAVKRVCSRQAIFTKEGGLADGSGKREVTVEDCCILMGELVGAGLIPLSRTRLLGGRLPGDSHLRE
jgi:predicted dehydrogenase